MFAPFEWMIALRYLRARRSSGFVSVIAGFSFLGIMLGVATLIVVMSVMNGFHKELLNKIVGINGHIFLQAADSPLTDYDAGRQAGRERAGRRSRHPDGRRRRLRGVDFAQNGSRRSRARHPGKPTSSACPASPAMSEPGTLDGFDKAGGVAIGAAARRKSQCCASATRSRS